MRPEILFPLFAPISTLKGVGPKNVALLERVAGPLVRDVLFIAPQNLVHRTNAQSVEAVEGETQIFDVTIAGHTPPARSNQPWRILAQDLTGFVTLVFFRTYGNSLAVKHPVGARRLVSGKVERFNNAELQIVHPDILDADKAADIPLVEAVYPATVDLPAKSVRRFALEALARAPDLPEWQDPAWLARRQWPSWRAAIESMHHPAGDLDVLPTAKARQRLAYDELLAHQLALAQRKAARRAQPAPAITPSALADKAEAALPFRLTGAQVRALSELRGDLGSGEKMSRLIQGDVGSGKTVVAMLAMADVAAAGLQSALMAPTEILARQHFETLAAPLAAVGLTAVLLTGRDKGAARADKLLALREGDAAVVVGTHALFQDDVAFKALALTVIDEQHRFGVSERGRLQAKGVARRRLVDSFGIPSSTLLIQASWRRPTAWKIGLPICHLSWQ